MEEEAEGPDTVEAAPPGGLFRVLCLPMASWLVLRFHKATETRVRLDGAEFPRMNFNSCPKSLNSGG